MAVRRGIGCYIDSTVSISEHADVELGDHVYIGSNVRIMAGSLKIGDYSKVHRGTLINPKGGVNLGHLTWIGQDCIIDGTGGVSVGNYFGVGMRSALYSHIRQGDILEGCNYNSNKPLIIGDDVWFVGQCLVSPITAYDKSIAMLGSVVTKDMEINKVYGGNPAIEITDKLVKPFRKRGLHKKAEDMLIHIEQYENFGSPLLVEVVDSFPAEPNPDITYYNITTRTYTKRNTKMEIKFNKWLFKYKAKFIPA